MTLPDAKRYDRERMTARAIAVGGALVLGACRPAAEEPVAPAGAAIVAEQPTGARPSEPDGAETPGPKVHEPGAGREAAIAGDRGALPPASPRATPESVEALPSYERADWKHWIDADGDCQDTRAEVLVAQSSGPVTFTDDRFCEVARGRWVCPYTGKLITDPVLLDVDHLVPLARAHAAGGGQWGAARRRAFANDLDAPMALVAVDRSANRSRGARGVHEWLPPDSAHRCEFLESYAEVVHRWDLRLEAEEEQALFQFLETCDAGHVPELAQLDLPKAQTRALTDPDPAPPAGRCCKHCKSGKPCGDTCIPKTRTCHTAPGCAC